MKSVQLKAGNFLSAYLLDKSAWGYHLGNDIRFLYRFNFVSNRYICSSLNCELNLHIVGDYKETFLSEIVQLRMKSLILINFVPSST